MTYRISFGINIVPVSAVSGDVNISFLQFFLGHAIIVVKATGAEGKKRMPELKGACELYSCMCEIILGVENTYGYIKAV